jgi:hypothetical protein
MLSLSASGGPRYRTCSCVLKLYARKLANPNLSMWHCGCTVCQAWPHQHPYLTLLNEDNSAYTDLLGATTCDPEMWGRREPYLEVGEDIEFRVSAGRAVRREGALRGQRKMPHRGSICLRLTDGLLYLYVFLFLTRFSCHRTSFCIVTLVLRTCILR